MAKHCSFAHHQASARKKLFLSFMPPQIRFSSDFSEPGWELAILFFLRTKRQRPLDIYSKSCGEPRSPLETFWPPKQKSPRSSPSLGTIRIEGLRSLAFDFVGYTLEKWRCWTPKMEVWQCLPIWFSSTAGFFRFQPFVFWGGNVNFGSWVRPLNQGSVLLFFSSVASMQTSLIWIQGRKNTPKNLGPKVGSLGIFVTQCTCFGHPKACWVFGTHSVVLESRGPRVPDEQMIKLQNKDGIQEMHPSIPVQAAWMLRWNPEASWGHQLAPHRMRSGYYTVSQWFIHFNWWWSRCLSRRIWSTSILKVNASPKSEGLLIKRHHWRIMGEKPIHHSYHFW